MGREQSSSHRVGDSDGFEDSQRVALVFPGQGSQREGMREVVRGPASRLLDVVRRECGADPFEELERGTHMVQPALFVVGVASWMAVQPPIPAIVVAGHSVGELAALVAAGALDVDEGLHLAVARGLITRDVARRRGGGMLAIGLDWGEAAAFAERHGLAPATDNAPRQVVLSGSDEALASAEDEARTARIRHRRLAVDGAFHSPLMEEAVTRFSEVLERVEFRDPTIPVLSCVTARPFENIALQLAQSLVSPVRWREIVGGISEVYSVNRIIEAAPGKVLSGLIRKIRSDVTTESLDTKKTSTAARNATESRSG